MKKSIWKSLQVWGLFKPFHLVTMTMKTTKNRGCLSSPYIVCTEENNHGCAFRNSGGTDVFGRILHDPLKGSLPFLRDSGSGNTPYWTQTGQRNRHGFPSFSPRIVTGPLDQDPRPAGPSGLQPGAPAQAQRGWSGDPSRPDGSSASASAMLQLTSAEQRTSFFECCPFRLMFRIRLKLV